MTSIGLVVSSEMVKVRSCVPQSRSTTDTSLTLTGTGITPKVALTVRSWVMSQTPLGQLPVQAPRP